MYDATSPPSEPENRTDEGRGKKAPSAAVQCPDPITAEEFLQLKFPRREAILSPWLPAKGLAMIAAPRGIGKTHLALATAYAVAYGGGFLGWRAPQPRRTLYVDGEMPKEVMQERLARIAAQADRAEAPLPGGNLSFLHSDLHETGLPDLSTKEGFAAIRPKLDPFDLIVLDNLSTLARSGRENEAESWAPIQEGLLELRRAGKSVLLIHHTGKGGQQRGTSKREDILDTVILLKRPDDYEPREGARFHLTFDKARGFHGDDAEPFEGALDPYTGAWSRKPISDSRTSAIRELAAAGLTQREIAREMGCGVATVNRYLHPKSGI
jgi:hypothetical protein